MIVKGTKDSRFDANYGVFDELEIYSRQSGKTELVSMGLLKRVHPHDFELPIESQAAFVDLLE